MGETSVSVVDGRSSYDNDAYDYYSYGLGSTNEYDDYYSYELGSTDEYYDSYGGLRSSDGYYGYGLGSTSQYWTGCDALRTSSNSSVSNSSPVGGSTPREALTTGGSGGEVMFDFRSSNSSNSSNNHVRTDGSGAGEDRCSIDQKHIEAGFKQLSSLFPEEAANIEKHRHHILNTVAGQEPHTELLNVDFAESGGPSQVSETQSGGPRVARRKLTELTGAAAACLEDVVVVVVDVVTFALSFVGLDAKAEEDAARLVARKLGDDTLTGFELLVKAINEAEGKMAQAQAIFNLLSRLGGAFWRILKAVWNEYKHHMKWWKWIKTAIIIFAQCAAWFATDGAAFVAEVLLVIMKAEQVFEDAGNFFEQCGEAIDEEATNAPAAVANPYGNGKKPEGHPTKMEAWDRLREELRTRQ